MGIFKFDTVFGMALKPVVLSFLIVTLVYEVYNVWSFFNDAPLIERSLEMLETMIEYRQLNKVSETEARNIAKRVVTFLKLGISYTIIMNALDATTILMYFYGMWKKVPSLMIPTMVVNGFILIFMTSCISGISVVLLTQEADIVAIAVIFLIGMLTVVISMFTNLLCPYNYYRQSKLLIKTNDKYKGMEKL